MIENKMSEYLYNHNYISKTKKWDKQEELSSERAEAIVNKHQNVINEEFKELLNYKNAFEYMYTWFNQKNPKNDTEYSLKIDKFVINFMNEMIKKYKLGGDNK